MSVVAYRKMLPRNLSKCLPLLWRVNAIQSNLVLHLRLVQCRDRVPINNANDLPLKRLRVQGEAHHEKRDYEGEFHCCILYQIWGNRSRTKEPSSPWENWSIAYIVSIFALIVHPSLKDTQSRFHPILKIHRGLKRVAKSGVFSNIYQRYTHYKKTPYKIRGCVI